MTVESPKYQVLKSDEDFEVRRYEPVIIAETVVSGGFSEAGSVGFRRLVKYISGDNTSSAKIAMTAPVGQAVSSEKISMTAPVGLSEGKDGFVVSFTMPAGSTLESLPRPRDASILLRQIPARQFAAIKYSGSWGESRYQQKLAALRGWMQSQQLRAVSTPLFARYDPPWTFWFLRRNEILIDVVADAQRESP